MTRLSTISAVGLFALMQATLMPRETLRCELELWNNGRHTARKFRSLQDATLSIGLRNEGEKTIRALIDTETSRFSHTPLLFEIKICAKSGLLTLPQWEPAGGYHDGHYFDCHVREIHPHWSIGKCTSIANWEGWQGIDLPPGAYSIQVIYWGCSRFPNQKLWSGSAASSVIDFEIEGETQPFDLRWSEPLNGLRIATVFTPSGRRFFFEETAQPTFLIENVSQAPIRFHRDVPLSEYDLLNGFDAAGSPVTSHASTVRGSPDRVVWTLPPGSRVKIHSRPMYFVEGEKKEVRYGHFTAPPGKYSLEYQVYLSKSYASRSVERSDSDIRHWDGSPLLSPAIEIELLRR